MSKKFKLSNIYLLDELFKELKNFDCTEEYRKEILDKFQIKTKTIYNANKDEDTIGCFISKVFGKKNLAAYFSFHCFEGRESDVGFGGDFVYLDGKLEFEKDYLTFLTNNVISYGTYEQSEEFGYKLFRDDNAKIFIKVEKDHVYFIVCRTDKNIRWIIKINEHFIKNPIIIGHPKSTSDYDNNKMIEWLENAIMEISKKKNVQEKSEKKEKEEKEEKVPGFCIKELKIYQIDN